MKVENSVFLKNVGTFVTSYKASHPRKTHAEFLVHMLCGQNAEWYTQHIVTVLYSA
jgi:hypothetical protein